MQKLKQPFSRHVKEALSIAGGVMAFTATILSSAKTEVYLIVFLLTALIFLLSVHYRTVKERAKEKERQTKLAAMHKRYYDKERQYSDFLRLNLVWYTDLVDTVRSYLVFCMAHPTEVELTQIRKILDLIDERELEYTRRQGDVQK